MMNNFVNYQNTRTSRRTAYRVFASLSFCVLLLQGNLASQFGQDSLDVPSNGATNASFHKLQVSITDDSNQEKRIAVTRVLYAPVEKQRN